MLLKTSLQNTRWMTEEYYWDRRRYPSDLQDVEPGLQIQIKLQRSGHNSIKFVPHQHTLKKKAQPSNQNCSLLYLRHVLILSIITLICLVFFPLFSWGMGWQKLLLSRIAHNNLSHRQNWERSTVSDCEWILWMSKQVHSTHRSLGPKQH